MKIKHKQNINGNSSEIDGIKFPFLFANSDAYVNFNKIRGLQKIKFRIKERIEFIKAENKLKQTLKLKKCFFGPFKGEFGNFLGHSLPFLQFLYQKGVEIHYCGLGIHKPLLVDENGKSIVSTYLELRDFFAEVSPNSNATIPPKDVGELINDFKQDAIKSGVPFWNIDDQYYYYFIHRPFIAGLDLKLINLSKFYKTKEIFACTLFPRSKGAKESKNNGKEWDYNEVVKILVRYFDKVYVAGHPTQSLAIEPQDKVELRITSDNAKILEACSNSKVIISQHSGVVYLSNYFQNKFLMIYKGGEKPSDIGSLNNTLYFKKSLGNSKNILYAFNENQIEQRIKDILK